MKETVVFDFDGVIHSYTSGWQGVDVIPDPPVPGIKEAISQIRQRYRVVVVSARCASYEGAKAIIEYLEKHGIEVDAVMKEKPPAECYIDDRAICFDGKSGDLLEKIESFTPWHKRQPMKQIGDCKNCNSQIEEMAKDLCQNGGTCSLEEWNDCKLSVGEYCAKCKTLAERLYNAGYRKQSEWISVDDRLPESGVLCLLCCDVKRYDGTHRQYVCDGFYAERFKEECYSADDECVTEYNEETDEYYLHEGWYEEINNWDEYSSIAIDDTVTHWMPLPEPPKMKGGE